MTISCTCEKWAICDNLPCTSTSCLVLLLFVMYFYFKKCLEIRHNFLKPFWDVQLQILNPFWIIFDNFWPYLIMFRYLLWQKSASWASRSGFCSLMSCHVLSCLVLACTSTQMEEEYGQFWRSHNPFIFYSFALSFDIMQSLPARPVSSYSLTFLL